MPIIEHLLEPTEWLMAENDAKSKKLVLILRTITSSGFDGLERGQNHALNSALDLRPLHHLLNVLNRLQQLKLLLSAKIKNMGQH